eukprot:TRINITY_DN5166_c0_g1_i3.p1 TRINITY_DN5166_c0_g1~~TRINITY_DN5166_c0_g1_i3.p1  ORF type:complete len:400 (+),score=64.72 TRINITY_DN5166_c0_g1_i3:51-1250(+)
MHPSRPLHGSHQYQQISIPQIASQTMHATEIRPSPYSTQVQEPLSQTFLSQYMDLSKSNPLSQSAWSVRLAQGSEYASQRTIQPNLDDIDTIFPLRAIPSYSSYAGSLTYGTSGNHQQNSGTSRQAFYYEEQAEIPAQIKRSSQINQSNTQRGKFTDIGYLESSTQSGEPEIPIWATPTLSKLTLEIPVDSNSSPPDSISKESSSNDETTSTPVELHDAAIQYEPPVIESPVENQSLIDDSKIQLEQHSPSTSIRSNSILHPILEPVMKKPIIHEPPTVPKLQLTLSTITKLKLTKSGTCDLYAKINYGGQVITTPIKYQIKIPLVLNETVTFPVSAGPIIVFLYDPTPMAKRPLLGIARLSSSRSGNVRCPIESLKDSFVGIIQLNLEQLRVADVGGS